MNHIKNHEIIKYLLDRRGISDLDYSLGECEEYKVCAIDSSGGYLIFDGDANLARLNEAFVMTPFELVSVFEKRINKKNKILKRIKKWFFFYLY